MQRVQVLCMLWVVCCSRPGLQDRCGCAEVQHCSVQQRCQHRGNHHGGEVAPAAAALGGGLRPAGRGEQREGGWQGIG